VLLTYLLGRQLYSARAAFLSALMMATNVQFAYLSCEQPRHDLAFFTTASMACFWMWYRGRERKASPVDHPWLLRRLALATLTSGDLVGLISPVLVCLT